MKKNGKKRWIAMILLVVLLITGCTGKGSSSRSVVEDGGQPPRDSKKGESYYYEKTALEGQGVKVMTQLQDGTIAVIEQDSGSTVWVYAPDGSKNSFETGKEGMVDLLGSNGTDTLLIHYVSDNQNQIHRYGFDGSHIDTVEVKDFANQAEGMGMVMGAGAFFYQMDNEIVRLNGEGQLEAWNLETGVKRMVREDVSQVLDVTGQTLYLISMEGFQSSVIAYDWETGNEERVIENFQGAILGGKKTPEGLTLVNQEWTRLNYDKEGKAVDREDMKEHFDELSVGMKTCQSLYFQGDKIYMTILDFESMENFSQSYYLTRKEGEDPNLADRTTLVIYTKESDFTTDFYVNNYSAKHPELRVQLKTHNELTNEDYLKKINTDILGGKQIDLVFFKDLPVKKLNEKGFFQDLNAVIDQEALKTADAGVLEAIKQDGKLIGLPIDLRMLGLYAEKTEATDAIYQAYMDSERTIEDFETMMDDLVAAGVAPLRKLPATVILKGLVANNLQDLVDEQGVFKADLYKRLVALADKLSHAPYVNEELDQDKYDFYGPKGTIALEPINQAEIMELKGAHARFEAADYWILPYPSESKSYAFSASMLGIVKDSKNKAAAVEFLQALALDEEIQESKVSMQAVPITLDLAKKAVAKTNEKMFFGLIQVLETAYGERMLDMADPTEQDYEKIIPYFQNSSRALVGGQKEITLMIDGAERYFKGEVGLDELIGSLRNQFLLYANE
ncbi:hypothetical protein SANA_29210 [Gottschalkiaceae bacterium SANA]|nr:hypothetical protein SANA_29210 [Gottschalkiaceae bacterium SANA]